MNYFLYLTISTDVYYIHMRDATIVRITCNNQEVQYDDLSLHVRESILIEALTQLAKLK